MDRSGQIAFLPISHLVREVGTQFGARAPWLSGGRPRIECRKDYPDNRTKHCCEQQRAKRDVCCASWLDDLSFAVFHGRKECITWLAA